MSLIMIVAVFVLVASTVALLGVLFSGQRGRLAERMYGLASPSRAVSGQRNMAGGFAARVIPRMAVPLIPHREAEQNRLKVRLVQAGMYGEHAMPAFLGVKMTLIAVPVLMGIAVSATGLVSISSGLMYGAIGGLAGQIGSDIWLRQQKKKRQAEIRRALPDALDMIVICVDGELSLLAALQRVSKELRLAHPLLANELTIVNRSSEFGQTVQDAMRQFAAGFDMQEVRYMGTIVAEAERFGTSVAKSLRIHADTLRIQRQQRAEEMARKAAVKIMFPTLLFIFPVIFVVVLLPSMIKIMEVLGEVAP